MYCNQCGAQLPAGVPACSNCGRAVRGAAAFQPASAAPAATSAVGRVRKHRTILGVLWLVRALMLLPGGLAMAGFAHSRYWAGSNVWGAPWGLPGFVMQFIALIGMGMVILGGLAIAAGVGLLVPQVWARMLAIVLGIIELVSIPFGTALGIYTLWVLLPTESEIEYLQVARARAGLSG